MPTERFVATTKYGGWKGTAAADDADDAGDAGDSTPPATWLRDKGYAEQDDVLVGITMDVGENYGKHKDPVHVTFLLVELQGHPDLPSKLNSAGDPVEVKRVRAEMNVADFLALFKRFEVKLSLPSGPNGTGALDGHDVLWLGE